MLYYNLERPHQGEGMNYRTPFEFFREKTGIDDPNICVFPPLILDKIPIYVPEMLGRGGDFLPDEITLTWGSLIIMLLKQKQLLKNSMSTCLQN